MKWEDMTSGEFARNVKECGGVCLLAVSCLEKHGDHLPLGTDMLYGRMLAEKAASIEPAIVYPPYFYGQINCARHMPGTVAISRRLLFDLLENVCDEISRNGMKKIILLSAHGGNEYFLACFAQLMLEKPRDYAVYVVRLADYRMRINRPPEWEEIRETDVDGHGGEVETSGMLVWNPDLVRKESIGEPGLPLCRLDHLPNVFTGIWWYADYPQHYCGDGNYGSVEKGRLILEYEAERVAGVIKAVKEDTVTRELLDEFYSKFEHGR